MRWQLRGVLARWEMASDCLISIQKHTYFHDYSPVVYTWRVSVCVCVSVCIFTLTQKRRGMGEGRKGQALWAKEGDGHMNNPCHVRTTETQLKLVSTVKDRE